MAITTLDGVIAGNQPPIDCMKNGATMEAAGVTYTHFYAGGVPGAASAPSPGLAGEALTSFTGQLDWNNPSGGSNSYLSRLTASASATGQLALIDRLWHNSGLAVTTTTAPVPVVLLPPVVEVRATTPVVATPHEDVVLAFTGPAHAAQLATTGAALLIVGAVLARIGRARRARHI